MIREENNNNNNDYYDPEFNSGISYLIRLDKLFRQLHFYRSSQDYDSTYFLLESLYIELYPLILKKAEPEEIKELNKLMEDTKNSYNTYEKRKEGAEIMNNNFFNLFKSLSTVHHSLGLSMGEKDKTLAVFK